MTFHRLSDGHRDFVSTMARRDAVAVVVAAVEVAAFVAAARH